MITNDGQLHLYITTLHEKPILINVSKTCFAGTWYYNVQHNIRRSLTWRKDNNMICVFNVYTAVWIWFDYRCCFKMYNIKLFKVHVNVNQQANSCIPYTSHILVIEINNKIALNKAKHILCVWQSVECQKEKIRQSVKIIQVCSDKSLEKP